MGQGLRVLALSVSAVSMCVAPGAHAQWASARATRAAPLLVPSYQEDYGYWRQQVRVASPSRHARWNAAPPGAVRVYHRHFDARWNWRSAPRHRVVYTYYRGDLWFLDPTTGWAYSVDRYGIVYTADPNRGWVYSLGPLTRWTADLLYFFDLYHFDRGYWYCSDYDYFVDLWEDYPRYEYYTYDTAYSTLWGWEPYFNSPTFITYSNNFSVNWIGQVRSHYRYMERNPHYRREVIDSIGLPAMQAAPPRMVSPRAVATTAYWEARDLAGAGMAPPPRGRDTGRPQPGFEAGTIVDASAQPSRVVEPGTPAPGFNAPFPDGSYGFGVRPGGGAEPARGRDIEMPSADPSKPQPEGLPADGRGRDAGRPSADLPPTSAPGGSADAPPQFDDPAYTLPADKPRADNPTPIATPYENDFNRGRNDGRDEVPAVDAGYQAPEEKPRLEAPREESGWEAPPEQPRYEAPPEQSRFEEPQEAPRYEEPRFEEPREEVREEPRYEAPREEPRYEAPREEAREEPRFEEPREEPREEAREEPREEAREEPRDEPKEERQEE